MKYTELKDEEVMALIAAGIKDALESMYDRRGNQVFSLAMHLLRDRPSAEEVTQDVFVKVWRLGSSYDNERGSVAAWLMGITHNRCIDELRKRRSELSKIQQGIDQEAQIPSGAPDPLDMAAASEDRKLVLWALDYLSREQKEVVNLAYFHGLTHSEIAKHLGQPLGTVKTRMRLALQKMRKTIVQNPREPQIHES